MAVINARGWLDERLGEGWFTQTARTIDSVEALMTTVTVEVALNELRYD